MTILDTISNLDISNNIVDTNDKIIVWYNGTKIRYYHRYEKVFQDVETFDTTIANTLDITAEWGQAKTQDEIHSANFVLHKTY